MIFPVLGLEFGRGVMRKACLIKPSANERQKHETRNKTVYRLRHCETKNKHCFAKRCFRNQAVFDSRIMFSSEHVRKSQSTIYLKSHGCVHGFQQEVSLIYVSTMFCLPCALSRNSSLRDTKPAGRLFV